MAKKSEKAMEETKKELSLEESFQIIENTVEKLEDPEITLEESFQLYKHGMEVIKHCNGLIDQVEKKVLEIQENGELDEF